jgi:hypothetical protein
MSPEKISLIDHEAAQQALFGMTVARAAQYLSYIFDSGKHEILASGVATTPIDLACNRFPPGTLAESVRITFWGGPPGDADWHQGTLLTLLIDKLFYCVATGRDETVEKFLTVLNDGKTRTNDAEHICAC